MLVEQSDHRRVGVFVCLGRVGVRQVETRAGEGDHHVLHPAAEAEVGNALLEGEASDADLALHSSLAETAGHDHAVDFGQSGGDLGLVGVIEMVGLDPVDVDAGAALGAGVDQRLPDRQVSVAQLDVLAHDRNAADALGLGETLGPVEPVID